MFLIILILYFILNLIKTTLLNWLNTINKKDSTMKLQELATNKIKQVGKLMESYFNRKVDVRGLSLEQAQALLTKTTALVNEVQTSIDRHTSQNNPAYLQALMMQEALSAYVKEGTAETRNPYAGGTGEQKKQIGMTAMAPDDIADPAEEDDEMEEACSSHKKKTNESVITEADVEEAQVTLAAQDVVDRIQKMYEDVAEMQYKDLPNLAQMMKQELGINQTQSYYDATNTAISTLVQALEQAKTDLESAMAPITGEEVVSPDEFATDDEADLDAGVDNDTPPTIDDEEEITDEPELDTDLGRERR
jgi:hypothetical protein